MDESEGPSASLTTFASVGMTTIGIKVQQSWICPESANSFRGWCIVVHHDEDRYHNQLTRLDLRQSRKEGQTALLAQLHLAGLSQACLDDNQNLKEPVGWHAGAWTASLRMRLRFPLPAAPFRFPMMCAQGDPAFWPYPCEQLP